MIPGSHRRRSVRRTGQGGHRELHRPRHGFAAAQLWLGLAAFLLSLNGNAQTCLTSSDLDDATQTAITAQGELYLGLAAKADAAALRQNATPSLAADFSGIEATIKDHQADLADAQSTSKSVFLLEAEGQTTLPHAEFYCGVFGKNGQTATSAVFYLDDLAPGKYAVAILEATSAKARVNFSTVLRQEGTGWKLAGLYIRPAQIAGHDGAWFTARAREFKTKGQLHNAWWFYLQARNLISVLPFMVTQANDKLYDEFQSVQPADVPAAGKTADLAAGALTYKITALFPEAVGDDVDLIVKYQSPDATNTQRAYQSNLAVIKALVAKYPEVRDAFAGIVARAQDSSGHDYGTLLAMKDIK